MNRRFIRHLQLSLGTLDFICVNLAYILLEMAFAETKLEQEPYYKEFFFFLSAAWLGVVFFNNTYGKSHIIFFERFARRSAYACLYFSVVICAYLVFRDQSHPISRTFVISYLLSFWTGILINRFLYLSIRSYFRSKEYLSSKVLIVGYNPLAIKLAEYLEGDGINKEIVGFSEEPMNVRELSRFPILSTVDETIQACKDYGVTEIYSTIIPEKYPDIYKLILEAEQNCIRFRLIPDIGMFVKKKVHIDYLHEIPIVSLRKEPLEDLGNRIRKRAFDIVVSFLVIVLILSWLVPLVGLLILLESRGPVFFRQLRSGKGNKPFVCLKFRSMRVNGKSHEVQATRGDERITRTGKILRRTSLDEFPQFLNVLRGQMSIIGPRPHMLKHTDQYSQLIGQYMVRQFLKPGISGWAQIHGYRGETQEVEQMQMRVDYDIWYMENWNLWLDVRIIFLTIFNAIKGEENAY